MSATKPLMRKRKHWRDELNEWTSPVLANLLWVLVSIPLLTIPLALSGLMAVMYHWVRSRRVDVWTMFFNTIRQTWMKCYLLALIDLVIGGFIVLNLLIILQMETNNIIGRISLGATLLSLFIFIVANVPAWVLVAVWNAPFRQIIKVAVKLVFINPIWAILTGLGFIAPFAFTLILPTAVLVTLTGAVAAAIAARGTDYLIRPHLPNNQMDLIDI